MQINETNLQLVCRDQSGIGFCKCHKIQTLKKRQRSNEYQVAGRLWYLYLFILYSFLSISSGSCRYCINKSQQGVSAFYCSVLGIFLNQLLPFTPITPTQDLPMLLLFLSRNSQQLQQQVPLMWIPVVLMPLLSSGTIRTQSNL